MNNLLILCPRCEADWVVVTDDPHPGQCLSRTTRDGGARVMVCDRCGGKEADYLFAGQPLVPMTEWPLDDDRFAAEELWRRALKRRVHIAQAPLDDLHLPDEIDDEDDVN
jgi:hypothetical protein